MSKQVSRYSAFLALAESAVKGLGYDNPIVTKSLRGRMRGAAPFLLMMGYTILMSACLLIAYAIYGGIFFQISNPGSGAPVNLGASLFTAITWCQTILIAIVAPVMTSGAISREHEKRTFEMIALTPLHPKEIIVGKTMSTMLFILTLLGASLPISSICIMLGGVSLAEILVTYVVLAAWAMLLASIGVFFSSIISSTAASTIVTMIVSLYYFVHTMQFAMVDYGSHLLSHSEWRFIFAGMNAGNAVSYATDSAPILGIHIPIALVGIVANIAIATLILTVAATKLRYYVSYNGAKTIRICLLGITVPAMLLLFGNIFNLPGPIHGLTGATAVALLFGTFWVVSAVFIPFFASGTIPPGKSLLQCIWITPIRKRIFETNAIGGFWFIMVWCVLWCAGAAVIFTGMSSGRGAMVPNTADWILAAQSAVTLLVTVGAFASIGLLLSALTNRVTSGVVTAIAMVVSAIAFPLIWAIISGFPGANWAISSGKLWSFAYFWPGLTILKNAGGWQPGIDAPNLLLPPGYEWLGCTIAWGIIALLALWGTSTVISRKGKVIE